MFINYSIADQLSFKNLRKGQFVAEGSDLANRLIGGHIIQLMKTISYKRIADIGCGNGNRLINFCEISPNSKGIGIEIDSNASILATKNVKNKGFHDRIVISTEDILRTQKVYQDIDTVTCFMMLHDIFGASKEENMLSVLLKKFPKARQFIFADTALSNPNSNYSDRVFTSGFELAHSMQEQKLFLLEEYLNEFKACNLHLEKHINLPIPNTHLFFLVRN
ncbi:MAG: methyltransferase domain-containing protein [Endozoicomonas sp. (ex Botrylloides leachii)]|nr:methyltransferase domain-containing protein [Endozoicomonas sp. (ex Botrylloides leachii)]